MAEATEELKNQAEQEAELNDHEAQEAEQQEACEQESENDTTQQEDNFKEKYYYLAAEMENMRKRFEREKQQLVKFGNEKILSDLIEVVDNLDRTLDALKDDTDDKVKNIITGVDMVRKQFLDALKNNGLERIDASGEKFDPNLHEAMAQQPSEEHEDDTVIMEYQKGYILNGRLLRPSKVIVAKN